MMVYKRRWVYGLVGIGILSNILIWVAFLEKKTPNLLSIAFLDIGQGDSVLITSPSGRQMLIDGGPDGSILRQLPKEMTLFDREIDVVLATHPDRDHINGLADVLQRYKVSYFIHSGVESDSSLDETLLQIVRTHEIPEVISIRGTSFDLGSGVIGKVLFPDRNPKGMETNDASIVLKLTYKDTCFIFTGDSPQKIEKYIIGLEKENLKCQVLKAGHHGSNTSTGEEFLHFVRPDYVVISAGRDNSYGHPHQDVLSRVKKSGAQILTTSEQGTVRIFSDGAKVWSK